LSVMQITILELGHLDFNLKVLLHEHFFTVEHFFTCTSYEIVLHDLN